jgi:hypothetical protein
MSNPSSIHCPKCGEPIIVEEILSQQLEQTIVKKYEQEKREEKARIDAIQEKLRIEQEAFEEKKRRENEMFQERLDARVKEERTLAEERIKIKLEAEQADSFRMMQEELNEKSGKLKEMQSMQIEIEKIKREKDELRLSIEAEQLKKMNTVLEEERVKIASQEREKHEMTLKEMQKKLDDQKRLTEEMKRKQEQGSMQLQGEVQELAIEEWLRQRFPFDVIDEVKKGARGGDCLQRVRNERQVECGKIYYESKRTKDFQANWIQKFKADMREKGADVGVLVTEAMPAGMERMGQYDGIWICRFEEFKGLCAVLREGVLQVSIAMESQEQKGDKMTMLYDYLTGNTFRMQVEAIVEGFTSMRQALDREKRSMTSIWKEREKQIDKVLINTIEMHASIKGIAGNAIQTVQALELPSGEDTTDDQ